MSASRSRKESPKRLGAWLDSFLTHRSLLARVIGRFVRPHEIEDIVQETFVRSYAAARKQTIRNPRAFMLRTAKNLALNSAKRADSRLSGSLETLGEDAEVLAHAQTPESTCESQEKFLVFCRAVAELPVHCRRVFILKKVYGLSQKEIGAYLGISDSTVEKHIAKGMLITTRYMLDHGYPVKDAEAAWTNDSRVDEVRDS